MEHVTVKDIKEGTGGSFLYGDSQMPVRHIVLDSREIGPGDLFVPLKGEKVDSHRFLEDVVKRGAACVLTSEHETLPEYAAFYPCAWIRVEDTKAALQAFGRYMRKRLSLPLVGITGSVGKTTTRELIAAALSAKYRVYKTPGNKNSQVGVPITISEISKDDQVGVIELGMSEPGELKVISEIACIDMAVITNIGITHIEYLGSRENIYREKLTIQDGLKDGGLLILNGDDDLLKETVGKPGVRTVYYGLGENCQYRAEELRNWDGGVEFTAVAGEKRQLVRLSVMGEHNVRNALAAIAVCDAMGMSLSEAAKGLSSFHGFEHRQQVFKGSRFTVLDDSYNASPASMKAALKVLMELPGKRHIAVLADMKELGEGSPEYHREVGEYAGSLGLSLAAVWGTDMKEFAKGLRETGDTPVAEFAGKDELAAFLEQEVQEGDCLLFKGSNSMGVSVLAERFKKLAGLSEG